MDLKEVLQNLNEENITLLYNTFKEPVFYFILNITRDGTLSEDITSEVFLRVLKYHKSYNGSTSPKTWIFTIAKNTTYTYMKKRQEHTITDEKLEFFVNQHNSVQNHDSLLVEESLSYLTELERNIVILHIFGGLTHLQISQLLGMEHSHIRARYNYALKKMYKQLSQIM